jgi:hypothetical protein
MAAEETGIDRERARPQQGDGGSHHDHFKKRQLAVKKARDGHREPGKRIRKVNNRYQDAHHRSEKSNQKAGAAPSQHQAGEKHCKRPIATIRQIENALPRGHYPSHHSHQQQRCPRAAAWKCGK